MISNYEFLLLKEFLLQIGSYLMSARWRYRASGRIPTVKLKIPGKSIFEIRIPNFCYIQVIVFDLSYLPVAAVGI